MEETAPPYVVLRAAWEADVLNSLGKQNLGISDMSSVMRCVRRAHFLVTEVLGLQCCIHLQSQTKQPKFVPTEGTPGPWGWSAARDSWSP